MKYKIKLFMSVVALSSMLVSCGQEPAKKSAAKFTLPEIPTVMTASNERADYLVKHYWANYDFTDTTLISKAEITEQAYVDFIGILPHVTSEVANKGIQTMMRAAAVDTAMFAYFVDLGDKYLYDPNSPFRNEEHYIALLNEIISTPSCSELKKSRPRYQLEIAMKNRVGQKAAEFPELVAAKGKNIILFFFDPECPACKEINEFIEVNGVDKKATIVKVNPKLNKELDELYDLRAMPTLYLLSSDKKVVLKDMTVQQITAYLDSKTS